MHVTSQYKGNPNNVSLFLSILLAPAHLGFHEFWKEKKKEKKKVGEKKTLHKIGRIVVCLSCVTSGNNYLMTTNPLNLQV